MVLKIAISVFWPTENERREDGKVPDGASFLDG